MSVSLSKTPEELREYPLVELAWMILREKKEPYYFRDLMKEIQLLRGMTDDEVMEVIARLYTEINIDGRFICLGQNVWGLKRWYPVDKTSEKSVTSKRFVRKSSGDAFSDDDEDLEDEFSEDEDSEDELESEDDLFKVGSDEDDDAADGDDDTDDTDDEDLDEDESFDDEDSEIEDEELDDEELDEDDDER